MKKLIKLQLPNNPTDDDKVQAIENILDKFIDRRGRFNVTEFAKNFRAIQEAIVEYIPDWEIAIREIPIYADDELSQRFREIFSKVDPNPIDFADLARNVAFDTSGTKQFSNDSDLDWRFEVPPLNEEIILYSIDNGLAVQAIPISATKDIVHFKNLGVGGDFNEFVGQFKWLPAKRFNDVKSTPEVNTTDIRGFSSSESQTQLSNLIRTYL